MNALTIIKLLLLTPPLEGQGEAYNAIKDPQWYSVQEYPNKPGMMFR